MCAPDALSAPCESLHIASPPQSLSQWRCAHGTRALPACPPLSRRRASASAAATAASASSRPSSRGPAAIIACAARSTARALRPRTGRPLAVLLRQQEPEPHPTRSGTRTVLERPRTPCPAPLSQAGTLPQASTPLRRPARRARASAPPRAAARAPQPHSRKRTLLPQASILCK